LIEQVANDEVVIVEEIGSGETALIDEKVPEKEVAELIQAAEAVQAAGIVVLKEEAKQNGGGENLTTANKDKSIASEVQKHNNSTEITRSEEDNTTESRPADMKEPAVAAVTKVDSAKGVAVADTPLMEIPKGITGISRDVEMLEKELAESKQLGRVIGITFLVLASVALVALLVKRWLRARNERERLKESRYYTNFMNYTLDMEDKDLDDRVDYVAMDDEKPMWLS